MVLSTQLKNPMTQIADSLNKAQTLQLLIELRSRLLAFVTVLMVLFAVLTYFANDLYTLLAAPLLRYLPGGHLIATQIVSPFFVPFKLAFFAALLISVPYLLYQVWGFVTPALYGHERRTIWPFLVLSLFLFYAGIAFAYFAIFPALFKFLANVAPRGVLLSPDIGVYLDFTLKMLIVFGLLFEIPMLMLLLVMINAVSLARFVKWRSYAIVGAFVLGMLLAPPEVLSQTLLAVPIWLLYEAGLLLCRCVKRHDQAA